MVLGHQILGTGSQRVVLLHDWFVDSTGYKELIPYLDLRAFTYALIDLRGYGKSKNISGCYTAEEASQDILSTTTALEWEKFHLVGYSISAMIAQRILVDAFEKVLSLIAISPIPATGTHLPEPFMVFIQEAAISDDTKARELVRLMTSQRLSDGFVNLIVKRWWEVANTDARIGYLLMFAKTDFSDLVKGLATPMLVLAGQFDAPIYRTEVMNETFGQFFPNCTVEEIANCGHFAMLEIPPLLVTRMEKFLKKYSTPPTQDAGI